MADGSHVVSARWLPASGRPEQGGHDAVPASRRRGTWFRLPHGRWVARCFGVAGWLDWGWDVVACGGRWVRSAGTAAASVPAYTLALRSVLFRYHRFGLLPVRGRPEQGGPRRGSGIAEAWHVVSTPAWPMGRMVFRGSRLVGLGVGCCGLWGALVRGLPELALRSVPAYTRALRSVLFRYHRFRLLPARGRPEQGGHDAVPASRRRGTWFRLPHGRWVARCFGVAGWLDWGWDVVACGGRWCAVCRNWRCARFRPTLWRYARFCLDTTGLACCR